MASEARDEGGDQADDERTELDRRTGLAAGQLDAPRRCRRRRDRGGHQEAEAGRRLAVEADEQAGRDRDPRAADAGDEGEGLGDADRERPRERQPVQRPVRGALRSASHMIAAPMRSVTATSPAVADVRLDQVVEQRREDERPGWS